jgi:hypothetical protein
MLGEHIATPADANGCCLHGAHQGPGDPKFGHPFYLQPLAKSGHVVAELLPKLNEPNARLGKNWLSRFLDRHPDLKIARNHGLDLKRITAVILSQIEGWFTHVADVV